jgi:hypothetical protein
MLLSEIRGLRLEHQDVGRWNSTNTLCPPSTSTLLRSRFCNGRCFLQRALHLKRLREDAFAPSMAFNILIRPIRLTVASR